MTDFDGLDAELDQLGASMEQVRGVTAAFSSELSGARSALASTTTDIATLETGLNRGLRKAFDGVIFGGMSLSDALKTLATSLIDTAYNAAIKPVTQGFSSAIANGFGGLFGGSAFADGGAFVGGKVTPFAKGGVISQATAFPMRGGMGLMGEAGPEAIMPLSRSADGALGVRMQGSPQSNVTINITTPDVAGFQRSQGQIAAQVNRALSRGQRNA